MTKQPNLILLIMDSARAANLSCYGYQRATTPHLDAIAAQGTLYEQAISVGCWTLPVHTSLFTGLYPLNHNVTISRAALPANFSTLAAQLKAAGYQTVSFSNNAYISEMTGLTQGFDTVDELWRVSNPRGRERTKASKLIKRLEQIGPLAKPAIRLLRALQHQRAVMKRSRNTRDDGAQLTHEKLKTWLTMARNPEQPFFIFVNYMECHEPYHPPHPFNQKFMPSRFSATRVARVGTNKNVGHRMTTGEGQDDLEILQALYDGGLHYLDQQIGNMVQSLQTLGILDETVLAITSDHGDSLGEHNQIGHRMALYEPLVHVPLIIRYPAAFQPGARVAEQVSLVDLYPTFLALGGVDETAANARGFYNLLARPEPTTRPAVFAENVAPKSANSMVSRMVRTEPYKYIWNSNQQHELYDLSSDPGELTNLVNSRPVVAQQLCQQLEAWQRSNEQDQVETGRAEYEDVVLERLRDLGYVE